MMMMTWKTKMVPNPILAWPVYVVMIPVMQTSFCASMAIGLGTALMKESGMFMMANVGRPILIEKK